MVLVDNILHGLKSRAGAISLAVKLRFFLTLSLQLFDYQSERAIKKKSRPFVTVLEEKEPTPLTKKLPGLHSHGSSKNLLTHT